MESNMTCVSCGGAGACTEVQAAVRAPGRRDAAKAFEPGCTHTVIKVAITAGSRAISLGLVIGVNRERLGMHRNVTIADSGSWRFSLHRCGVLDEAGRLADAVAPLDRGCGGAEPGAQSVVAE